MGNKWFTVFGIYMAIAGCFGRDLNPEFGHEDEVGAGAAGFELLFISRPIPAARIVTCRGLPIPTSRRPGRNRHSTESVRGDGLKRLVPTGPAGAMAMDARAHSWARPPTTMGSSDRCSSP